MSDELLTVEEVAQILKVGRTTIYLLTNAGELSPIRIRRSLRFPRSTVDAFIARKLEEAKHA